MSARLISDMEAEAQKAASRAHGYRMAGERNLAGLADAVAHRIAEAVDALALFHSAEGEARNRELEA